MEFAAERRGETERERVSENGESYSAEQLLLA